MSHKNRHHVAIPASWLIICSKKWWLVHVRLAFNNYYLWMGCNTFRMAGLWVCLDTRKQGGWGQKCGRPGFEWQSPCSWMAEAWKLHLGLKFTAISSLHVACESSWKTYQPKQWSHLPIQNRRSATRMCHCCTLPAFPQSAFCAQSREWHWNKKVGVNHGTNVNEKF